MIVADPALYHSRKLRIISYSLRIPWVALGQKGKQHFHFIAILLDIADIIQDDTSELVQLGEFLRQGQITLSGKQALHQAGGAAPEHGMTLPDQSRSIAAFIVPELDDTA
jgi:hypothetical protein